MTSVPPDGAEPPPVARDVAPQRRSGRAVSIDWFEATVKDCTSLQMRELVLKRLGWTMGSDGWDIMRDDAKGFDAKGPLGMRVRADRVGQVDRTGERRGWAGVRLSGELCRAVGTDRVLDLAAAMAAAGDMKVSRLDVALDDFDKTFSPREFASACVNGRLDDEDARLGPCVVTRVRDDNWEWSRRMGGCFWLGGRSSDRLLRVYDKDRESDGRIASTRIELQSRDDFGTALCRQMLAAREAGQHVGGVFLGHLVEFVDLRQPQGARSSSQTWPRLAWWAKVVGDAVGIAIPRRADSEVWGWVGKMAKQSGGFLAVMLRAAGVDPRSFARAPIEFESARKIVSAVRAILDGKLPDLTGSQSVRLEQLQREGWRGLRFGRSAGGPP